MPIDLENTQSSRARLLASGKTLFAKHGYEQTSTASIAREAMTSESQLIRNFGGKAGLLQAIFNQCWEPLNRKIAERVGEAPSARDAIQSILSILIDEFLRDQEIAFLFLFEGRRFRGHQHEVALSEGFVEFLQLMHRLIERAQEEGSLGRHYQQAALASAIMGAAEGMIRDRLAAIRSGLPPPFSEDDIRQMFQSLFEAL
ncbi:MAG TPA: TetR/AcrR family transcriptional regulator [Thermoanaerobaculia bacterium]|nr:TetR/AcrR family transcriptional regulator [Thermoanaerobaculia bacterium]